MKRGLIEKLRDVKNEISYIKYKVDRREQIHKIKTSATHKSNEKEPIDNENKKELSRLNLLFQLKNTVTNEKEPIDNENKKELSRLNLLFQLKNTVTNEIIELQNAYTIVDTIFYREISKAEKKQNKWWFCLFCFYWNKSYDNSDYINDLLKGLSHSLKELIIP